MLTILLIANMLLATHSVYRGRKHNMGRLERLLNKADNFKESGRFEEAIKELKKAMRIAPRDPDVYLSFALTYDAMEEFKSSILYFKKAIEIAPEDSYIWTQLGITLGRMGSYAEALAVLHKALTIEPNYTVARWNLALTYRALGCYEDALTELTECANSDPDSDYVKGEIHYQLGLCYFDMGWTLEALREFKRQTELFPDDVWAHLSVGNCYMDSGWIDESIGKYKEIINASPDFVPAYNSLALSLVEKGWYDEALDVLKTALEFAPDDESIKEHIEYIQSLKDDEGGFKGLILYIVLQILKGKHSSKN